MNEQLILCSACERIATNVYQVQAELILSCDSHSQEITTEGRLIARCPDGWTLRDQYCRPVDPDSVELMTKGNQLAALRIINGILAVFCSDPSELGADCVELMHKNYTRSKNQGIDSDSVN